jgi:outer membrane receptor protein involved in Fe transport
MNQAKMMKAGGPPLDKGLEFVQWNSYTVGGKPLPWISRPNNIRDIYRIGITANNSVALSGATDKATYRLSFGSLNQKGMLPNTDYNRYTIGLNSSYKLLDNLISSFSLTYSKDMSGNLPTAGYDADNVLQQTIWSARNVDFNALKDWRNLPLITDETSTGFGTPLNWNARYQNNPFWVLDNNLNKYNRDRLIGNIQLNYNVHKYVSVMVRSGVDFFSQIITEQKAKGTQENIDGYYRELHRRSYEINTDLLLTYSQSFLKDRLSLALNAGGTLNQQRLRDADMTANALEVAGLYTIANIKSGQSVTASVETVQSDLNTIRTFGEISWDRFIYLNYTLTNDWSSRLPKANNSFLSYSVGGSFVASELIKKQQDILSFLKIRGSYASVGNFGALVPYRTNQTYAIRDQIPLGTTLFYDPASLNNPNLKPERSNEWEVGLDLRLYKNRFRINATYYDKTSKDLLMQTPVSAASGYTTAWKNAGKMNNKGVELQFGATLLDKKDYKIDIDFNWAKNYNKVLSVGEGQTALILGNDGWGTTLEAEVGQPYGSIRGLGFMRAPDGQVIFKDGVPVIDPTKKTFGTIQPKWTGGVSLSVNIKGVTISTLIDMKIGGVLRSMTYSWGRYAGTLAETLYGRETGIVGEGVKNIGSDDDPVFVPNDVVVRADFYNQTVYSNKNVENGVLDASYIKWRRLFVGYTLPAKALKNTKVQEVGFGVVASNILIIYRKAPHIDPETAFSDANGTQGLEFGQMPAARSIGFNFNIKF